MRCLLLPFSFCLLVTACGEGPPNDVTHLQLPDGGQYRGEQVDGRLQGHGRVEYANGAWYEGAFEEGLRHGQGEWQAANGDRYRGAFRDGLFHGIGRLDYAEGGTYEGEFAAGRLHGQGTFSLEGTTYIGRFVEDRYHGPGVLSMGGETFEGDFHQGELQGRGQYRHEDGAEYDGEFRDTQFHGEGRYADGFGNEWTGSFHEGALTGSGRHTSAEGEHYEGEFRTWRYHGQGRLIQADGSRYAGTFSNGRFDGEGTLTRPDGGIEDGFWRDGRRVRDANGERLADPLDLALMNQGRLLDAALAAVPPSTPAVELYTLVLAGDGRQSVFRREADYVTTLLAERFGARGQITLVNHRDSAAERPLATTEHLAQAVETLARRSGPEDLLFIYLTSHGSADHALTLHQPRLALADLPAADLADLLAPLAGRDKVVVISACYSGGFIPPLKDPHTLVMAAARADRVSFGCTEQNDFTFFGRALFAEALQHGNDLEQAFTQARARVAEWEQAEDYQASEPQLWAPPGVLTKWRTRLASGE